MSEPIQQCVFLLSYNALSQGRHTEPSSL